jgi:hypothetical protein
LVPVALPGAGSPVEDDALAEPLLQILRDHAGAGVDRRPWREWHDELDGLVGIGLRSACGQATEKQNGRDEELCPGHARA